VAVELQPESKFVRRVSNFLIKPMRGLLLAGVAALAISACAINPGGRSTDFSAEAPAAAQATLSDLAGRYKARPRDKGTMLAYAAALRAVGQPEQAVSVLEAGIALYPRDADIKIAYAKALSSAGRFDQALTVVDDAIVPQSPDWNALLVKGAILDQQGQNDAARAIYTQALLIAPNQASIEANLGLSYAMSNDLASAEAHLRKAASMPGATSKIRQNLGLVIGLQGRFKEAQDIFSREMAPEQVQSNMAYIRAMLTQQNRWDTIKKAR
jgi:Flp pilus assembly protein TadD